LLNVRLEGETAAAETPAPVPFRVTVWLEAVLPALSEIVNVAVRAPPAAGENVTEILHDPEMATLPAQVFVVAKSPAFVPAMAMLEIVSAPVPPLLSVTVCAELVVPTF
jgi:hypothetical protein